MGVKIYFDLIWSKKYLTKTSRYQPIFFNDLNEILGT